MRYEYFSHKAGWTRGEVECHLAKRNLKPVEWFENSSGWQVMMEDPEPIELPINREPWLLWAGKQLARALWSIGSSRGSSPSTPDRNPASP